MEHPLKSNNWILKYNLALLWCLNHVLSVCLIMTVSKNRDDTFFLGPFQKSPTLLEALHGLEAWVGRLH